MTQARKQGYHVDVHKTAMYAIIINAMQIVMLATFVVLILFTDIEENSIRTLRLMAVVTAFTASWGAVLDIRQALRVNRRSKIISDLTETNSMMDTLNLSLRAQRHDFLNHLQVVYSLMEMEEYDEASDYLEKVYGEIKALSSALRTKSAAVNALLQVKMAACEEQGVALTLDIATPLDVMGMPAWEVCCILSNLMDNAIDASKAAEHPSVHLALSENPRGYMLAVRNNGTLIAPELTERIFEPGVSTKGEGRGMGLAIVRKTLGEYGGGVQCESGEGYTMFTAFVPRA